MTLPIKNDYGSKIFRGCSATECTNHTVVIDREVFSPVCSCPLSSCSLLILRLTIRMITTTVHTNISSTSNDGITVLRMVMPGPKTVLIVTMVVDTGGLV